MPCIIILKYQMLSSVTTNVHVWLEQENKPAGVSVARQQPVHSRCLSNAGRIPMNSLDPFTEVLSLWQSFPKDISSILWLSGLSLGWYGHLMVLYNNTYIRDCYEH